MVAPQIGNSGEGSYGSRNAADKNEFDQVVKYFAKAWNLRTAGGPADQVVFAKALYGWGLTLHDRSSIDVGAGNQRNPALVKAAQQKFAEFLSAVRSSPKPRGISLSTAFAAGRNVAEGSRAKSLQIS